MATTTTTRTAKNVTIDSVDGQRYPRQAGSPGSGAAWHRARRRRRTTRPSTATSSASSRMTRHRDAPSVNRTLSSRVRSAARANCRFTTFAHAMPRTASGIMRNSPTASSESQGDVRQSRPARKVCKRGQVVCRRRQPIETIAQHRQPGLHIALACDPVAAARRRPATGDAARRCRGAATARVHARGCSRFPDGGRRSPRAQCRRRPSAGRPRSRERPTASGAASKARRHIPSPITTAGPAPGRPSARVNSRPRTGDVPSVVKKSGDTKAARALADSPRTTTATTCSPCAARPAASSPSASTSPSNSAGVSAFGDAVHRTRASPLRSTMPGTAEKSRTFSAENAAPHTAMPMPSEATTVATCAGAWSSCRHVTRRSAIDPLRAATSGTSRRSR